MSCELRASSTRRTQIRSLGRGGVVIAVTFAIGITVAAQQSASKADADEVAALLWKLSNQSVAPVTVLDPQLSPGKREKSLSYLDYSHYELTVVALASIPVRVHFLATTGNSLDANATAEFVRRDGQWYFADFQFMAWPAIAIVGVVLCGIVGISYATTVLILFRRLKKQPSPKVNVAKIIIPFYWPALFRQTETRSIAAGGSKLEARG